MRKRGARERSRKASEESKKTKTLGGAVEIRKLISITGNVRKSDALETRGVGKF